MVDLYRKHAWTMVVFLLLLLPTVSATLPDDIVLETKLIKNRIGPAQWAEFELTIHNNGLAFDAFTILNDLEGTEWSMLTEPQTRTDLIIKGGTSESIKILLKDINLPRDYKRPYFVKVFVYTKDRKVRKYVKLPVYLMPGDVREGVHFEVTPDFPKQLDPRRSHSFIVNVKNENWYDYEDIRVSVKSADFERVSLLTFAPNETKSVEFTVFLPPDTPPKNEKVALTVSKKGTVYFLDEQSYTVIGYNTPFQQNQEETSSFLKTKKTLYIKNVDNDAQSQEITQPVSTFASFFTSTDPETQTETINSEKHYVWDISLNPKEEVKIIINTNYRGLFYAGILLAIVLFLWYMFQSPVVVVKRAEFVKTQQGGINSIDIRLVIYNRGGRELRDVTLVEHVPTLMKTHWKSKHTFHPKRVSHVKHGKIMYWEFDLTPKEERIISYTLIPRLSVIGDLTLPRTMLRYTWDKHKLKSYSNEVRVSNLKLGEQEEDLLD